MFEPSSAFQHIPNHLAKIGLDDIELSLRHGDSRRPAVDEFKPMGWPTQTSAVHARTICTRAKVVLGNDRQCYSRTALPPH